MKKILVLTLFLLTFSASSANKAYEIAKKVDESNSGFFSEVGTMEMILISSGKEIKRLMESQSLEISDDETRTLLNFKLPKDVRGTKLLTYSFDSKNDSQWIYLSAFKRVKRITSSSKSSSFMGSEFTFEDLRNVSVDKFDYKFIKEEKKENDTFWHYEKTPKEKSGYTKQVLVVSKKYLSSTQVDYYDRSGQLLKTATFDDFKKFKYQKRDFWRPGRIHMKNIQTLKESKIIWKNRKLGVSLKKKIFKKSSLK